MILPQHLLRLMQKRIIRRQREIHRNPGKRLFRVRSQIRPAPKRIPIGPHVLQIHSGRCYLDVGDGELGSL